MIAAIREGNLRHLETCCEAVRDSELGRAYFQDEIRLQSLIQDGLVRGEIRVALAPDGEDLGFIWFSAVGMFYRFPYVRLIAVRSGARSVGVGTLLLSHVEELFRERRSGKVFLTVAEFNDRARRLYERLGYSQLALIPDLFFPGYAEHLMVKELAQPEPT